MTYSDDKSLESVEINCVGNDKTKEVENYKKKVTSASSIVFPAPYFPNDNGPKGLQGKTPTDPMKSLFVYENAFACIGNNSQLVDPSEWSWWKASNFTYKPKERFVTLDQNFEKWYCWFAKSIWNAMSSTDIVIVFSALKMFHATRNTNDRK